eukprot:CAMPEP_0201619412 /NCGR_PEP_ID=MMETSP0492-20130828/41524_1 /ASSEMBLY_ACC=CAM_ASM_000837 /TAXON_ID=420259 /ORGANISM="Thalassiosira gravida, Strain GMp14c1" /LENGTH=140 /DNA_ID=CAMNT_0048088285 /DNA_START=740 /DNA_END=1161 /DNA_ORIENTATION=-
MAIHHCRRREIPEREPDAPWAWTWAFSSDWAWDFWLDWVWVYATVEMSDWAWVSVWSDRAWAVASDWAWVLSSARLAAFVMGIGGARNDGIAAGFLVEEGGFVITNLSPNPVVGCSICGYDVVGDDDEGDLVVGEVVVGV